MRIYVGHTECTTTPVAHHRAQTLDDLACLDRSTLGLSLFSKLGESAGGDFVATELGKKFLLCW